LMFALYQFTIGLFFWVSFPFLLAFVLITGKHRRGLMERLGFYRADQAGETPPGRKRIWIHAASIGEVRAARILIEQLRSRQPDLVFVVTTMTVHGRDFGRQQLGSEVGCFLAPLDVPFAVNRCLSFISADMYVCLETELWPLLIGRLKRRGVPAVLINGRLSDKSIPRYRRFRFLFGSALRSFRSIGAITAEDRQRFIEVGADPGRVVVTGNLKHDVRLPEDRQALVDTWRARLSIEPGTNIFIAGSTHEPEEKLLLPLIRRLINMGQVVIIAPRHLTRLAGVASLLAEAGVSFEYLSTVMRNRRRSAPLVVVDTFGDLLALYGIATFVFVGGSLSGSGGHNLLEPAAWGTVVFFGPDVEDFRESAALLEACGGGAAWRMSANSRPGSMP
jgi:3-deoxy-D-manno-octulosonic-acid transferase